MAGDPEPEETERERRMANLFLLGAAIVVVGRRHLAGQRAGRRAQEEECFESGRRNCNPISVLPRDRDQ